MGFPSIRSAANSIKFITVGALAAAGAAGFALSNNLSGAKAADTWTAVALPNAQYWCVSDSGCTAGGVGPIPKDGTAGINQPSPIGKWEREVVIKCKHLEDVTGGTPMVTMYQVEVQDKNWSGSWDTYKSMIKNAESIDDRGFPVC